MENSILRFNGINPIHLRARVHNTSGAGNAKNYSTCQTHLHLSLEVPETWTEGTLFPCNLRAPQVAPACEPEKKKRLATMRGCVVAQSSQLSRVGPDEDHKP